VVVSCCPVALLTTTDDPGPDAKILCVSTSKVTAAYDAREEILASVARFKACKPAP
jgi:inorganic pyrophosphatase